MYKFWNIHINIFTLPDSPIQLSHLPTTKETSDLELTWSTADGFCVPMNDKFEQMIL